MEHSFEGKWISDGVLSRLKPRNVFSRQLDRKELDCTQYRNRHVLFRRKFCVDKAFFCAKLYISADDYYKLYINGRFVAQGPSPSYHFCYGYNEIDVGAYLSEGENVIAVHTFYQGLINRVWQSGDFRHGLICDLLIDGETVLRSDPSFLVATHSGYTEAGVCGYKTQILEQYDSGAPEVGFEAPDFDDSGWTNACLCRFADHTLQKQQSHMLVFENIPPVSYERRGNRLILDFGSTYVGYLSVTATGSRGDVVTVRGAQELDENGNPRFVLRANCQYEEPWILSGGRDVLNQFDYKAFRYAELVLPEGVSVEEVHLVARHYPFTLKAKMRPEYEADKDLRAIWELCVHSQKYGVQEVIHDCMEREKGFYLGDGCYSTLANMILTGDDSMARKMIDDAFASSAICDTLMTCMDCSFMQEIAEYPLMLVSLVLWHYRLTGDKDYLHVNYPKATALMEAYRRDYEKEGLLRDLDKWCVVEWPKNFQHGYAANIEQGKVCHEAHIAINAYYIYAIRSLNAIATALGEPHYRDISPLLEAFWRTFYRAEEGVFTDSEISDHVSLVGNAFAYGFDLCPDEKSRTRILDMIEQNGIDSLSFFGTFAILMRLCAEGEDARVRRELSREGAWLRMLREGGTTTFEGWGRDTKWNTSLFHLAMTYGAVFLADVDRKALFAQE